MSDKSSQPEDHHPCHHPDCCPPEAGLPAGAQPAGEAGLHHHDATAHPALGALKRWLLWFLTFFGIYASSSVCPFCGTPGCPVGVSGAAVVGGVFAALWEYGRQGFQGVSRVFKKIFS
jgi:hypothetical protein